MVSRHQLRKAIKIIEEASAEGFSEITAELDTAVNKIKLELENTDAKHKLLNNDMGKAQTLFGFDENFFSKLDPTHSFTVQSFVKDWMIKQSDWRYPLCVISPSNPKYTEHGLKSNLVYVLTNNFNVSDIKKYIKNQLDKGKNFNPGMFRQKPLDHTGIVSNEYVPHNQIGTIFSCDYFPYISIGQLKDFFASFEKILRPGGEALIHITDADCEDEWKNVLGKKITYCTSDIVKDTCEQIGLILENVYHVDSMYTFYHLSKKGNLTSNKAWSTKIERV